jgi:hypothetical protein
MADAFIQKALKLAGPLIFEERPTNADWKRTENDLGLALPLDYKDFVKQFGSGRFGDIQLFNPCASGWPQLSRESLIAYRRMNAAPLRQITKPIYPDDDGLIWVATSGSQVEFFLDSGKPPESAQVIMIDLELSRCRELVQTLPEFLYKLFQEQPAGFAELRKTIWSSPSMPFFTPIVTRNQN